MADEPPTQIHERKLSRAIRRIQRRRGLAMPGLSSASSWSHRFLEFAATETNDSLLGLHVAAEIDLRDAGILFYLAAAFDDSRRSSRTPGAIRGNGERSIRALNRATNHDFAPSRMTFAHPRNSGLREIHRILRCPVEFAQTTDSWVFPQRVMELPITSGDSRLLHILEAHADDLLAERHSATGLRGLVENKLLSLLPTGRVQMAAVARQFGMSERSFKRHLAQEGTTFGEILDRVRNRLALRYLEDRRMSLQQIAWLLGYSEIGAFNHAFKRWTGTSPGRARDLKALSASAL